MAEGPRQDGARSGCARLPLQLLEIAMQELELREHESRDPQVQETLAAFSERLRSLSSTDARATSTQQNCTPPTELPIVAPPGRPDGEAAMANSASLTSEAAEGRGEGDSNVKRSRRHVKDLIRLFNQIDIDGNGQVGLSELSISLKGIGFSDREVRRFMSEADTSGEGVIDQEEFLRAMENHTLADKIAHGEYAFTQKTYSCMLRQSSPFRMFWDMLLTSALSYLAILEPVFLAFPEASDMSVFQGIGVGLDIFFLSDVLLNFRTGFNAVDGFEVMEPCEVAKKYLKTWFLLDLISSLPLSLITADNVGNLQVLRLLKYWKIMKVFKALRFSRSITTLMNSDLFYDILECIRKSRLYSLLPLVFLLVALVLTCHWLACFMIVSGDGFLGDYLEPHGSEYLAGFYFACTTMSTVGYGDITPSSNFERLFTIIAMTIGGALYGFFIAKFTAIVTRSELSEQAYSEKMQEVDYWLQHHRFPRTLRRRARRYYERHFRQKTHVDDHSMLDSLSPDLRVLLGEYIVVAEVRNLHIFTDVPAGFMSCVTKFLKHVEVQESEPIVQRGEVGVALYVVIRGGVKLQFGDMDTDDARVLEAGDSFGEELLLERGRHYDYTAIAQTHSVLKALNVGALLAEFQPFPRVLEQIMNNASSLGKEGPQNVKRPKHFENEVIELLRELQAIKGAPVCEPDGGQKYLRSNKFDFPKDVGPELLAL